MKLLIINLCLILCFKNMGVENSNLKQTKQKNTICKTAKNFNSLINNAFLAQEHIVKKENLYELKDFILLNDFLKMEYKNLLFYLQNIPKNKDYLKKIKICADALKFTLNQEVFNKVLINILDSNLSEEVKINFISRNLTYLKFNYPTKTAQYQLNKITNIVKDKETIKLYNSIINGHALFYDVELYCTGALNYISGEKASNSFVNNFSQEMHFLRHEDNLYITLFAIYLHKLKSFIKVNQQYKVVVDNISYSLCKKNDLKTFMNNKKHLHNHEEKELHLKRFIQLALFAKSIVKKKALDKTLSPVQNKYWNDCLQYIK